MNMNFSLTDYLSRIGFSGTSQADIATLKQLMQCQLRHVAFENLSVQAGLPVSLQAGDIVEKIVHQKRGGYCYEVNGLFAMALDALGIAYQLVAARPMFYPMRRPKTHMAVVAHLNGQSWLCDLGFGAYGICEPLRLDVLDTEVQQGFDTFLLKKTSEHDYLLQARVGAEWQNQYEFNLSPCEFIDFEPANYMNSNHPGAIFVQKFLVVVHHEQGRSILVGDTLKTIHQGVMQQEQIPAENIASVLKQQFGLTWPLVA